MLSGCGEGNGGVSGSSGGTISLSWEAETTNADGSSLTDLAGYRIYYGTSPGVYTESVDVGNETTYTLIGLNRGQTYYVALTAYDTSLNESEFSTEVSGIAK